MEKEGRSGQGDAASFPSLSPAERAEILPLRFQPPRFVPHMRTVP